MCQPQEQMGGNNEQRADHHQGGAAAHAVDKVAGEGRQYHRSQNDDGCNALGGGEHVGEIVEYAGEEA